MVKTKGISSCRRVALVLICLLCGATLPFATLVRAHNNPGFKEVLLLTIDVTSEPVAAEPFASYSAPFGLDLPKKTIELIWRVADGAGANVTFSVAKGDVLHAEGLTDGANSRILRGDDIRIVDVAGATGPFSISVYANVIDRSTSEGS